MIVSDVGRTTSGSSSAELGSGSTAPAPPFPVARSRVWVTIATSLANLGERHLLLAPRLQVADDGDLRLALVGAKDQRPGSPARRRELELLPDRLLVQRVLHRHSPRAQLGGELHHRRDVFPTDCH